MSKFETSRILVIVPFAMLLLGLALMLKPSEEIPAEHRCWIDVQHVLSDKSCERLREVSKSCLENGDTLAAEVLLVTAKQKSYITTK